MKKRQKYLDLKATHLRSRIVQFELSKGWKKRSGTTKGLGLGDLQSLIDYFKEYFPYYNSSKSPIGEKPNSQI